MSPADPSSNASPQADQTLTRKLLGQEGRPVRLVGDALLFEAIDLALRESIRQQRFAADDEDAAAMARAVQRRFREILARHAPEGRGFNSVEFLQAVAMARDQLLASRERFRHEIASLEAEIDQRRSAARAEQQALDLAVDLVTDPVRSPVAARLRQMFAQAGADQSAAHLQLRDEVVLYVLEVIRSERRKAVELQMAEHQRELDNLERRIHKLVESLETTEGHLKRLARMKGIDPGLASIYREVQGLGDDELHLELKRELLGKIFEANLKLKDQLENQPNEP